MPSDLSKLEALKRLRPGITFPLDVLAPFVRTTWRSFQGSVTITFNSALKRSEKKLMENRDCRFFECLIIFSPGLNGASEHATIQWFSLATEFSCSGVNVSGEVSLLVTRWYVHGSCKAWAGPWTSWIPWKHWETLSSLRLSMIWKHHQQHQPLLSMTILWYCLLTRRLSGSWIFEVLCSSPCLYDNCSTCWLLSQCFQLFHLHSFDTALSCRHTISPEVTFCFTHRLAQAGKPSGLA